MNYGVARVRDFKYLTKIEIKQKIDLLITNELKHDIAVRYYINEQPQIDIAEDLGLSRSTIARKLYIIKHELG